MGLFSNIFSKEKKSPQDKNETFLSAVRRMDAGRDDGDGVFPRIMMSMPQYLNAVGADMPLVHKLAFLQINLVVRCGLYLQGDHSRGGSL